MSDTAASAAQNVAPFHASVPSLQSLIFGWWNLGTTPSRLSDLRSHSARSQAR